MHGLTYRVYPGGEIVTEDDFCNLPEDYCDDYEEVFIPFVLLEYLEEVSK